MNTHFMGDNLSFNKQGHKSSRIFTRLGCAIHHENMPPVLYIHNHCLQTDNRKTISLLQSLSLSICLTSSLHRRRGKGCPAVSCCHLGDIYYGYVKALRVWAPTKNLQQADRSELCRSGSLHLCCHTRPSYLIK